MTSGTVTRDFEPVDERVHFRLGVGMQFFRLKIDAAKTADVIAGDAAAGRTNVPEQVLAPLFQVAIDFKIAESLIGAAGLGITPLYVVGAGLFPSVNPSAELAYRLTNDLYLDLGGEVTTIKYPIIGKTTTLRLDTTYLAVKFAAH